MSVSRLILALVTVTAILGPRIQPSAAGGRPALVFTAASLKFYQTDAAADPNVRMTSLAYVTSPAARLLWEKPASRS